MTTIPTTLSLPQLHSIPLQSRICELKAWHPKNLHVLCFDSYGFRRDWQRSRWVLLVRASGDSQDSGGRRVGGDGDIEVEANGAGSEKPASALHRVIGGGALPPTIFLMKRNIGAKLAISLCVAFAFFAIAAKQVMHRKHNSKRQGSVADLVRRGQLRSDRRGISKPLKYEDPFNNPLVKASKSDSTVEICGKVYRMAPVTLTKDQQSIHQKRRSRAYQWKRPTVFLKEGDSVPPDVDPDTIRWIPANHPFATTVSDIDEDLAQNNVFQKHGVPFRVKVEHEAMQKKLEALQNEQKLNQVEIDPNLIRDFERPFKLSLKQHEQADLSSSANHKYGNDTSLSDQEVDFLNKQTSVEEGKEL